jgi:hypothetical protein
MVSYTTIHEEAEIALTKGKVNVGGKLKSVDILTSEEIEILHGYILYTIKPYLFEARLTGYEGEKKFSGTAKQWDEYLDALPCTLCKKAATECDCKPL